MRYLGNLCRGLTALGVDVTVFTTSADGKRELPSGVTVDPAIAGLDVRYFSRAPSLKGFFYSRDLGIACSRHLRDFDIVHISTVWTYPSNVAARTSSALHVPYVVSPHGMLMPYALAHGRLKKKVYMRFFEKENLDRARILHCTSNIEESDLKALGVAGRSAVIPCGVEIDKFSNMPPRGLFRQVYRIEQDDRVILHLGRLHRIKGIDILLDAFERVTRDRPDTHLILAGEDEQKMGKRIETWARLRGIAQRVHLTGMLDESRKLAALADADVFVMASHSENFGMSVAEAMAAGLPVLVSSRAGISEWVAKHAAGIVARPDSASLAQGLFQLLAMPKEQLGGLGESGRKLVASELSVEVTTRQIAALYESVLGERCFASQASD